MAMLKKDSEVDMKAMLANASHKTGKLIELVYMNHNAANKAKKASKL